MLGAGGTQSVNYEIVTRLHGDTFLLLLLKEKEGLGGFVIQS